MPLITHKHISSDTEIGLWSIGESIDFFQDNLALYWEEINEMEMLSSRKAIEWYASRYLIHLMSGREQRGPCLKDEYGKPYLVGSTHNISFSHSHKMVAAIASKKEVGIDIQIQVEKITRIAKKFCSESEYNNLDKKYFIPSLHVIWGAKESIYKAYGRRNLDFKKDISIEAFEIVDGKIKTSARLNKNGNITYFNITGEIIEKYVLVYAIESEFLISKDDNET